MSEITLPMLERYERQIILSGFGADGQRTLMGAHVVVVGAGGLGALVLMYLVGAGVGQITLIDHDVVSLSNLHRQVLFSTADVGRAKVEAAAERLAGQNPHVKLQAIQAEFKASMLAGADVVLDCTDNFDSRYAINAAAVQHGVPLVSGAVQQWYGYVSTFNHLGSPCYACLFPPDTVGEAPSCSEIGVLGPAVGVISSVMAGEAIQLLLGKPALAGKLWRCDISDMHTQLLSFAKLKCAVCSILV